MPITNDQHTPQTPARFAAAALSLLIAMLLTSGCSTQAPQRSASPAPSPNESRLGVSPTMSPSSRTIPAAARSNTDAGAIAFTRFYIDEIGRGQVVPGSVDLSAYALPTCQMCKVHQEKHKQGLRDGVYAKEAPMRIRSAWIPEEQSEGFTDVFMVMRQEPVRFYKRGTDKEAKRLRRRQFNGVATLVYTGGSWKIAELVTAEVDVT